MRTFLGIVMYSGAALSVLAFFLPSMDYHIAGLHVPPDKTRLLSWVSLGMVVVGYFGRRLLRDPYDPN